MKKLLKKVNTELDKAGRGLDQALGKPSALLSNDPTKRAEAEERILGITHAKKETTSEPTAPTVVVPSVPLATPLAPAASVSEVDLFLLLDKALQIKKLGEMQDNKSPKEMREFVASIAPFFVNMDAVEEGEIMEVLHTAYDGKGLKSFFDKVAAIYIAMPSEEKTATLPKLRAAFQDYDRTTFSQSLTEATVAIAGAHDDTIPDA